MESVAASFTPRKVSNVFETVVDLEEDDLEDLSLHVRNRMFLKQSLSSLSATNPRFHSTQGIRCLRNGPGD